MNVIIIVRLAPISDHLSRIVCLSTRITRAATCLSHVPPRVCPTCHDRHSDISGTVVPRACVGHRMGRMQPIRGKLPTAHSRRMPPPPSRPTDPPAFNRPMDPLQQTFVSLILSTDWCPLKRNPPQWCYTRRVPWLCELLIYSFRVQYVTCDVSSEFGPGRHCSGRSDMI